MRELDGLPVLAGLLALAKAGVRKVRLREDVWEDTYMELTQYRIRLRLPLPKRGPVFYVRQMQVESRGADAVMRTA